MKNLYISTALLLVSLPIIAQNGICSNKDKTFIINLNTEFSINHQINTPYIPVTPTVINTLCENISLTLESNVNENKLGIYFEEYFHEDTCGNIGFCRRYVRVIDTTTALKKGIEILPITIFPNPVKDYQFTIELKNSTTSDNNIIELYDLQGRTVFYELYPASSNSDLTISLKEAKLENGIYILNLKQGNSGIKKVIVIQ